MWASRQSAPLVDALVSEAAAGLGSPPAAAPSSPPDLASVGRASLGDAVDDAPSVDAAALAAAFVDDAAPRSFFAQPEPLKWIAGITSALRMVAPQTGHPSGPWLWMPCTTSMRCAQAVQM
jgi:hypothetical protein